MVKNITLDQLAELMMGEFNRVHERIDKIEADVVEIKADIVEIKADIRYIYQDLADIHRTLDRMQEQLDNHDGHTREIDYAFTRISRIENHLGLSPIMVSEE